MVRSNKGLSLIELIVAMALSSIVFLMFFTLFSTSMLNFKRCDAENEIMQDARYGLDQITREVRMSTISADSVDMSDPGVLYLKRAVPDSDIIIIKCGDYDGRKVLKRMVSRNNVVVNSRKIIDNADNIIFSYDRCDKLLSITLTVAKAETGDSFTLSTTVLSRIG